MEVLHNIQSAMTSDTVLVAVSKYRSIADINYLHRLGIQDFGENRVQELVRKANELPFIHWHLIGQLQTNKVAAAVQFASLIHSLDRVRLAEAIQKEAFTQNKIVNVLIQVNISKEESKAGFLKEEVIPFLRTIDQYPNIAVKGVMCMGPNTEDATEIRKVFKEAKMLYQQIHDELQSPQIDMKILSMGMSNDYEIALQEGSNMLRIGSLLFNSIPER